MGKEKNLFEYVEQALMIFGLTVVFMSVCSYFAGEHGKEISPLFSLGAQGLSISTMAQMMGLSVFVTLMRFIFMSGKVIKKMSLACRTIGMVLSCIVFIVAFIVIFDWFPAGEIKPWLYFAVTFCICFVVSFVASVQKEKNENRKMTEALERYKNDVN